jgi:hypothetical protein
LGIVDIGKNGMTIVKYIAFTVIGLIIAYVLAYADGYALAPYISDTATLLAAVCLLLFIEGAALIYLTMTKVKKVRDDLFALLLIAGVLCIAEIFERIILYVL